MILGVMDNAIEPRGEFSAATSGQPTLEHRKLKPVSLAFHDFEDAPPALLIGDVVGDYVEAF